MTTVDRVQGPAEKDVWGSLHHALPDHYALPVIGVVRRPGERGEHRFLRLLDLQQQWRAVVCDEQADRAERADAADTDGLEGDVAAMIALHLHTAVLLQRLGI